MTAPKTGIHYGNFRRSMPLPVSMSTLVSEAQLQFELHADSHMLAAHSHAGMRVNTGIQSTDIVGFYDRCISSVPLPPVFCINIPVSTSQSRWTRTSVGGPEFLWLSVSTSQSRWTRISVGYLACCINVNVPCCSPGGPEFQWVLVFAVCTCTALLVVVEVLLYVHRNRRFIRDGYSFTRLAGFM